MGHRILQYSILHNFYKGNWKMKLSIHDEKMLAWQKDLRLNLLRF